MLPGTWPRASAAGSNLTLDIVLKGPKEFADQYALMNRRCFGSSTKISGRIQAEAASTDLPDGPTFDSKMRAAEDLLPDSRAEVTIADLLRVDWQRAIAFERHLSDRLPHLHAALEDGRRRRLGRAYPEPTHPGGTP